MRGSMCVARRASRGCAPRYPPRQSLWVGWPANPAHPLAASQQLAVSMIMHQLSDAGGLFAVNGPPGTGKTTLLRDVISAVVVARADRLAALPYPSAGFVNTVSWNINGRSQRVRVLDASLTGFEMVIASENNAAVENVSREIPALMAIDEPWWGEVDYFAEHATRVLGSPAWGLIAATLGNRANTTKFVKKFWFGDPPPRPRTTSPTRSPSTDPSHGAQHGGPASSADRPASPTGNPKPSGISTRLDDPVKDGFQGYLATCGGVPVDWPATVRAYRRALAAQEQLRAERTTLEQLLAAYGGLVHAVSQTRTHLRTATIQQNTAAEEAEQVNRVWQAALQREHQAQVRREQHLSLKPGTLEMLVTFGRAMRRWHAEDEPLATDLNDAHTCTAHAAQLTHEATTRLEGARRHHAAAERAVADATSRLDQADRTLAHAAQKWGADLPDETWWSDQRRRELAGPWLDQAWNTARTNVFVAALDLHKAFITANANTLSQNMVTMTRLLQGQAPRDLSEKVALAAWQSLFLIVPVVSTTFASVPRLFHHLNAEALGWLFIDEAGQARPQSALGAIWRSRRVVAVGDPMQLEPVITVLNTTQQALRRHYGVAETWLPAKTCVQSLADRITPYGTRLPGPDQEDIWVGLPLRVHRRCEEPMFTLVNQLAYDGMMIPATPSREWDVEPTRWVDVEASTSTGNWIPDEGEAVAQILDYLIYDKAVPLGEIFVITPFRQVRNELRNRLSNYRGVTIGTVHTTQGQEREVVIVVLGSNPDNSGARAWAAGKPNLLNVAASRAKRRLFIVGNRALWSQQPHFSLAARLLEHRPFNPRR